jgi:hypothetical protein
MKRILSCLAALAISAFNTVPASSAESQAGGKPCFPGEYNVVWESQSEDTTGSMPLGGGGVGLNVWVEKGDLLFYISSPDAIDENSALLKLGRVRLQLSPNPFADGGTFRQELDIAESCIRITGQTKDAGRAEILIWVDVFRPVVHVEVEAAKPVTLQAALETWRHEKFSIDKGNWRRHGTIDLAHYSKERFTLPDHVERRGGGILWYHRNDADYDVRGMLIKQQKLEEFADKVPNPTKDLTFGGLLAAQSLEDAGTGTGEYLGNEFKAWKARTAKPSNRHHLVVALRIEQDKTIEQWQAAVLRLAESAKLDAAKDRQQTLAWWRDFWLRSYVRINPDRPGTDDAGWQCGRNYNLFRYMLACNVSGRFPTKFNGGIFSLHRAGLTPDYRTWGGAGMYMGQNQRLVYWPMLKAGDFDVMLPALNFYRDRAELQRIRAKLYWGIDGTPFPEAVNAFGLRTGWVQGWWRPKANDPGPGLASPLFKHLWEHYTSAIEFAYMILEYERFTGKDIRPYMPVVEGMIVFFDNYYRMKCKQRTGKELGDDGKLVLYPAAGLEYCGGATNPTDTIAGLMALTDGLLALGDKYLTNDKRVYYQDFRRRIPPIPTRQVEGDKTLAVAESWEFGGNKMEFPQLYAVFPFGVYGVGKGDLKVAVDTWKHGAAGQKFSGCWAQGGIFTARMGLTDEAKEYCIKKFLQVSGKPPPRFPAFWVSGGCYPPDFDHGGSAMIGLQEMLMQTDGRNIRLLPAWPKDWDVDFKLHAPQQTVVEGSVRAGKIVKLNVTPEARRLGLTMSTKDAQAAEAFDEYLKQGSRTRLR